MSRQVVETPGLAAGPGFSQVVRAGDLVVVSGQVARNETGDLVGSGDAAAQARQVFANIRTAVEAAGGHLDDVVKLTLFLTDPTTRVEVAAARDATFRPPRPASTLVVVAALADPSLLLEVEALAHIPAARLNGEQARD